MLYATTVALAQPTAPAHHVLASCKALRQMGHEVYGIYRGPKVAEGIAMGAFNAHTAVAMPPIRGGARLMDVHLAVKLLQRLTSCEVLYLRIGTPRITSELLKHVSIPKVLEVNGNEIIHSPEFASLAHSVDLILTDSEPLRQSCLEHSGLPQHRVAVHVSPAVDEGMVWDINPAHARSALKIGLDEKLIVHVSGFQAQHDFPTLIGAMRLLKEQLSNRCPQLILVGAGPRYFEVQQSAQDLIKAGVVKMVGTKDLDEVGLYVSAADICVNSFTKERLRDGNLRAFKLYQYLGSAKPTIEAVDPNVHIDDWAKVALRLIPAGSPKALSEAVLEILLHQDKWEHRARLGKKYVMENRTWSIAMASTVAAINTMLARRATR